MKITNVRALLTKQMLSKCYSNLYVMFVHLPEISSCDNTPFLSFFPDKTFLLAFKRMSSVDDTAEELVGGGGTVRFAINESMSRI